MRTETVNPKAVQFHREQYDTYLASGMEAEEAEARADMALIEWSKSLPLPPFKPVDYSDAGMMEAMEFDPNLEPPQDF